MYKTLMPNSAICSVFHSHLQASGWSALFFAAKDGHLEITKALLKAGADPMLKNKVCSCVNYCVYIHMHVKWIYHV